MTRDETGEARSRKSTPQRHMKHMPRKHTPAFLAKAARRQQRRALNQTPARHKREMDRQLVDARKEISKGCANVAYLLDKYRLRTIELHS